MKTSIITALLLSCAHLFSNEAKAISAFEKISETTAPRTIQVLLEKDANGALLEIRGGAYYILNPHDQSRISSGLLGKRFMIHETENGLKWGEEFPGIHQIYIKPRDPKTSIFVNGTQYSGAIAIYGIAGTINIVNDVDIEEYVKTVLAPQFLTPLEPEALSALAILTRTDAYYRSGRSQDSFWQVTAAEVGYQGTALVVPNSLIERAVDTTKHLILVHPHNGKNLPFAANWTEHSAGKTASYQSLFRKEGNTAERGVDAPHAALARQDSKWQYVTSKKTLARLLDVSQIKSMELFVDQASNKVYGLRINSDASSHDFDFFTLQNIIGKAHLRSSDFTMTIKDDTVTFSGFGVGHGVGLCLYSANALAQNGENALKILSKFFPETYLYNIGATPKRM